MKKLVFGALALAVVSGSGCKSSSEEEASIEATWAFSDGTLCAADDSDEIWFFFTPNPFGPEGEVGDQFNCNNPERQPPAMAGTIGGIPLGAFNISAELYGTDGAYRGYASPAVSVDLNVDGQVLQRSFTLAPEGPSVFNVSFSVDFGNAGGSNCDSTDVGGTGVTQLSIDLIDQANSQCAAVTISDDDATADYEDTCAAANSVCADSAVTLTMEGVAAGQYQLQISGYPAGLCNGTDPVICWYQGFAIDTATFTSQDVVLQGPGGPGPLVVPFDDTMVAAGCESVCMTLGKPAGMR